MVLIIIFHVRARAGHRAGEEREQEQLCEAVCGGV